MSAKDQAIIKRMRDSNIPPYTFKTTLANEGQPILAEITKNRTFKTEDGHLSYMIHAGDSNASVDVCKLVATFAKELVLTGTATYYTTVTALAREIKYEYQRTDESPVLARRGKGMVAIGAFDEFSSIETSNWLDTLDWLISHAYGGGGLVLGQGVFVAAIQSVYGADFSAFADTQLQQIRVKV